MSNIIVFYLVFVTILFCSCGSGTEKYTNNNSINLFDTTKLLREDDSLITGNCVALVTKSDTVVSEMGCSKVIRYYNKVNKIIINKSRQICLSDTSVIWEVETYFNEVVGQPSMKMRITSRRNDLYAKLNEQVEAQIYPESAKNSQKYLS